ncbi:MAG: NTP transferase domain-containing protein [Myxococcales bacterium]|nr:NTP transferase domain-containing protein [Myxococcales bacterium]
MKAVILAAGVSSRLRPHTDALPKCLLPVAGVPILRAALETLDAAGVHDVAIVSGYRERQVRDAVRQWFPERPVTFISNAAYASTNNCVSLLLAEGFVQGSGSCCSTAIWCSTVLPSTRSSVHPTPTAWRCGPPTIWATKR